jgi:hypothetical protein
LAQALGNVWVRSQPSASAPRLWVLAEGTPVRVLAQYGIWVQIEWEVEGVTYQGWTLLYWITLYEPISPGRITPTPTLRAKP